MTTKKLYELQEAVFMPQETAPYIEAEKILNDTVSTEEVKRKAETFLILNKEIYEGYKQKAEEAKKSLEPEKEEGLKNQVLTLIAIRAEDKATELVAEQIKLNNSIVSIKQDKNSEIWFYHEGIYKPNGESHIKEICREILGEAYTPQRANKVIAKIEADTYQEADIFFKREQENLWEIPTEQGILNLKTKEISPFTPKKVFFNKINAKYSPQADCPSIKKFMSEIFRSPEDGIIIFEAIGHSLLKKYFLQTAIMILGEGENGKGVLISLIKSFLGHANCSCVPLNQLTPDSFSCAELFGKLVNLAGDISNTDLKETGRFKELRSGTDLISAKRKFQKDLNFVNYAKLFFNCNELPRVYDFSHGFWRSWMLLETPYKFLKKSEYEIIADKTNIKLADPEIINKLTTPEELSGLLNEALRGLDRILTNKQFSYTKSTAEVKELWIRKSDSFTAFAMDMLEEDSENYISKKILRKEFNNYCKKHKIKGASDNNIKAVLENIFGVVDSKKVINAQFERENVWEGIRFKRGVKEVKGFLPLSQNGNMPIGSKGIDTLDIKEKESIKDTLDTYNKSLEDSNEN